MKYFWTAVFYTVFKILKIKKSIHRTSDINPYFVCCRVCTRSVETLHIKIGFCSTKKIGKQLMSANHF